MSVTAARLANDCAQGKPALVYRLLGNWHSRPMDEAEIRLENVKALIARRFEGVRAAFAKAVGRDDAQIWQLLNRERNIGERLARDFEKKLGLPRKSLDEAPGIGEAAAPPYSTRAVPVVGTAQLGDNGHYAELEYPAGHGDGYLAYPTRDPNAYAVRVRGDSMRPRIKPGEFVVCEPSVQPMPGDEVLVRAKDGRVMVKVFDFRRDGMVQLSSVNEGHPRITIEETEVERIHYVAAIVKRSLFSPEPPRSEKTK